MLHNPQTATMLGFTATPPVTPISFLDLIVRGFPVSALDRVSETVAPADSAFKYRIVSKTTLARRRKHDNDRLSTDESERLVRLTDVWTTAVDVWKTGEAARAFLFRPHAMLDGRPPINVALQAEVGAQIVKDILGRLKYGSAA
ncbi:MAG TPA: antitoxin Xre-like helix-turn-helix domain-containing protein [Stellaceae bacterium]|nr:antitoxin Xre-like helix-turn-helix domain-containing protein [Stellaceae bacterium]